MTALAEVLSRTDLPLDGLQDALIQAVDTGSMRLLEDHIRWLAVEHDSEHLRAVLQHLKEQLERAGQSEAATIVATASAKDTPTVGSFIERGRPHAELAERYLALLLGGQRREASKLIMDSVDAGIPIRDVYLYVFQASQYEIGRLWHLNEVSVAQEHMCTAATQLIMSQLYDRLFAVEPRDYTLVSACVADDLHEIGGRILTDFFEMEGWETHYVGASTPADDLAELVDELDADVVALSVTLVKHLPQVTRAVAAVRKRCPEAVIIVGGYPFLRDPGLVKAVGGDGTAEDAAKAVELATRLVEARG